ncbi:MAG: UDPglucose--hexose-phosphate uridylyltransferase [Gaiellaceae bacterium]|nr:UDPglucose--hexose-phosphate uridylyltransferase [Gaiellaceae bacterium]
MGAIEPPTPEELASCPFCEGREDRTPPETLRLPFKGPWSVRVVPNLYPAFERQEVVVHTPRHVRTIGELEDEELERVAEAWRLRARSSDGYVHALLNEGQAAGASLPHSHSQLVWLDEVPPAVREETDLTRMLEGERVLERDGVVAICPLASRLPYEVRIAPADPEPDAWDSDLLAPALQLLAEIVRRLYAVEGPSPLNAWLHNAKSWHLELLPRLAVPAGIELGAGIHLNALPPEDAAAALRGARPKREQ